jgi:hypothetical protein
MTTDNNEQQLMELDRLEKIIAKGLTTYNERNNLIVSLVAIGIKQAEIARRINKVREKMGAPTVTPDAVAATLKRVARRANP